MFEAQELEKAADGAEQDLFGAIPNPKARAFLRVYAACGNLTEAARAVGVVRQSHYYWMEHLPGYREAAEQAREMATDRLEREAWRRAVEGWDEPVYQKGQLVATVRRYSDALLMLLLRANRPEKYRKRVEVGSEPGRPLLINTADAEKARRLIEVMATRRLPSGG